MEREFEPQPLNIDPMLQSREALGHFDVPVPDIHIAMLILLMLMPWVWVSLGLLVIGDYRLTIAMYELMGCALPVFILGRQHFQLWPLRCNLLWILGVAAVLGTMIIGVYLLTSGFGMDWSVFQVRAAQSRLSVDGAFWLFAIVIGLINPFLEEAFWRGLIYRAWEARLGPTRALWISSFFFGAWHWVVLQHYCNPIWAVVLTLLVMVGGSAFCLLYERTRTLGSSILLHGLGADFPMIFVVYNSVINHLK